MQKPSTLALAAAGLAALIATGAQAQNYPITPGQRSTAEQVAQAGVPLSELAPNAPDQYTIKRGDTLWAISGIFLKSPWRWPELWGMNMEEVHNPHLIYPGQVLVLEKVDGRARLRVRGEPGDDRPIETVRVSPQVRVDPLPDGGAIPMLQPNAIEPFLAEPVIIDEAQLKAAPRIVAVPENRVLITRGDRAYARGLAATPLMLKVAGRPETFRIFRDAKPITHPVTHQLLGFEAKYLGRAELVRGESAQTAPRSFFLFTSNEQAVVPATIDIVAAKDEIGIGDRLLPEPPRQFVTYAPHAPRGPAAATIVSVYGDAGARKLLAAFGLPAAIFAQPRAALDQVVGASLAKAALAPPEGFADRFEATWQWLASGSEAAPRQVLALGDARYPAALLQI